MNSLIEKPKKIADNIYLLKIQTNAESIPGQFISIKTGSSTDPLLRRPFSIFNHDNNIIEILIKVIGKGTEYLSNAHLGEIDMLGPMGNGFSLEKNKKVLLAGGGIGNAPLYYLGKKLKENNNDISFIFGTRSKESIYFKKEYKEISNNMTIVTDDGSEGRKGFVTDIVQEILSKEKFDKIYTCGPTIMMKILSEIASDTPIEISVENYFGCGIGLCVGCTIETIYGLKRACIDGPVFKGNTIVWSN